MDSTVELSTSEAAEKLHVNPGTVRRMCKRGALKCRRVPYPCIPDGSWAVTLDSVLEFIKEREQPKCKKLSEVDCAYIAGFFDGEGCFTSFITKKPFKMKNGQIRLYYQTAYFIQIIVKDEAPIRWLKEVTGAGSVFMRKRQNAKWKDLWGWRISGSLACEVIEQFMPYLKIKHRQAEIFLQIRDIVKSQIAYRLGKDNCSPRPRDQWVERQKLIDEIHVLNDRGGKRTRMEFTDIA